MNDKEESKEKKIEQLKEIIKNTEKNIQLEKSMTMEEYNNDWKEISSCTINDEKFKRLCSDIFTPEELDKMLEDGRKAINEDKTTFEAEQVKIMDSKIKNLNALKRKLKRLKAEKPKSKLRKAPEFKIEPLI